MTTKTERKNVGVLIAMLPEHRTALKNLARALAREKDSDCTMSSVVRGYLARDPRFQAELRRIRARGKAKRAAEPATK